MNETLCRALLRARLTEEDLATHLQVDPKTVRRWLEGRVPYMRHRWAIAAMLGADETDLWPQLRTPHTRPDEVVAVYPHAGAVPTGLWLRIIGSARREIGILDDTCLSLAGGQTVAGVVAERARAGVSVRMCLTESGVGAVDQRGGSAASGAARSDLRDESAVYAPLRENDQVELRLHRGIVYGAMYYTDDQLVVSQRVYGIVASELPVLYLQRAEGGDMVDAYLSAFDQMWADATRLD